MKKETLTRGADKSAKKGNDKANKSNPLAGKVVKDEKKSSETPAPAPVDQEKEKAISEAQKSVESAQAIFAEAKTKLAEAKNALRKLTGKKSKGEPKGPGVIATIFTLVNQSGKKGISKQEILDKLVELFPDRALEGMSKTIAVQLPGRMSKEKKVNIVKLETGAYVIEK
jgi:hypothetical protein